MRWPRPVPTIGDQSSAAERAAEPGAWRLTKEQRAGLYATIAQRRDVRRFRPDPLGPELVARVLGAAHAAPSVGHSQPWRFVLVTDPATREHAAQLADRERHRQARQLDEDAARRLVDLQLEGIREAPLGIVVCCDRRVEPAGVLGRSTFVDADLWSCACAIENLWLAARAEGLGIGWVTLFEPRDLARLVDLPDGVATLGWLCCGWPDERNVAPGLERAGWSKRLPLREVVLEERWPVHGPRSPISRYLAPGPLAPAPPAPGPRAPAPRAVVAARDSADELLSVPGSLGALDRALDRVAALGIGPGAPARLVIVAAEHPVAALGVSSYPSMVTREVLEATLAGESLGAAAARAAGLAVVAVDAGLSGEPPPGAVVARALGPRGDLVSSDALCGTDVDHLLDLGRDLGRDLGQGDRFETEEAPALVCLGEVGIGNTTLGAAVAAALIGIDPGEAVGLGAGADTAMLERKRAVVADAVARARADCPGLSDDPLAALGALGGPELVVLTGIVLGVADRGGAVVLDGLVTSLAGLVAVRFEPGVAAHLVAGQRSRERVHPLVLEELGLEALLDLALRAGEGVGAVLACKLLATGLEMRALAGRVGPR